MTQDNSKPALSQFDWQMNMLLETLGAELAADQMTNAYLAQIMQLQPSGVTQRRKGETLLRIGEPAKIIKAYGLNSYGLDERLFDISDPEQFRQTLKDHGVGLYETNARRRLVQKLEAETVSAGLSVNIREPRGRRGITYNFDTGPEPEVYHVGQHVEIVVEGKEGQHTAIVQHNLDTDYVLETLAPTTTLPDTYMAGNILVLPSPGSPGLKIRRPAGRYRLMVVEGSEDLILLFAGSDFSRLYEGTENLAGERPVRITDQMAKTILERLEEERHGSIRCAVLEYIVA